MNNKTTSNSAFIGHCVYKIKRLIKLDVNDIKRIHELSPEYKDKLIDAFNENYFNGCTHSEK